MSLDLMSKMDWALVHLTVHSGSSPRSHVVAGMVVGAVAMVDLRREISERCLDRISSKAALVWVVRLSTWDWRAV